MRGLAEMLGISAAHQSDIELGRRMPSDPLLRATARALTPVGTPPEPLYTTLRALDARVEPDVQAWMSQEPGVQQLLREVKDSGRSPLEVLRELQRLLHDPSAPDADSQRADDTPTGGGER